MRKKLCFDPNDRFIVNVWGSAIACSTSLPLEDALQLVRLYAERGSAKYERAALRWLERYLTEGSPRLKHIAEIAHELAHLKPDTDG